MENQNNGTQNAKTLRHRIREPWNIQKQKSTTYNIGNQNIGTIEYRSLGHRTLKRRTFNSGPQNIGLQNNRKQNIRAWHSETQNTRRQNLEHGTPERKALQSNTLGYTKLEHGTS